MSLIFKTQIYKRAPESK